MLEELKKRVCDANLELKRQGVVIYTWGNVSGIDRNESLVVIKPSGIDYDSMKPEDMVVVELLTGKIVEGRWKPSSDTETHLELYKKYEDIEGIVHTHSINATAFAQAGCSIQALGTTHADYFYGNIPCTRSMNEVEVQRSYEKNTGLVIIETIDELKYSPLSIPGILVKNHGPFAWGESPETAVHNAVVMEKIAEINLKTLFLNKDSELPEYILDKHYLRKHGKDAYYGQQQ